MSTIEVKEVTVIRYLDPSDGEYVYANFWLDSHGGYSVNEVYAFDDASNLDEVPNNEDVISIFEEFQDDNPSQNIELVRIKRTLEVSDAEGQNDELKELRQKIALGKLSEQDIRVLGLTKTAVYIKTKYHNA